MTESDASLPPWDGADLAALLSLEEIAPGRLRNRHGDPNVNGRSYGGQVLGQTLMAASRCAPEGRFATMMQFLFLKGAMPHEPVEFEVAALQDGKRFSSRQVRGVQRHGDVLDAHVSFAVPLPAPEHDAAADVAGAAAPETLPALSDMPAAWDEPLWRLGGYSLRESTCIDFRVPDAEHQISPEAGQPRLRFWLKSRRPLPPDPAMHAAAFAYLSDWWLNFSSLGLHMRELGPQRRLYIASLNHCIWFHRPFCADEWLHVDSQSPCAAEGRGLAVARVHDRQGRPVASATQECLMAFADPAES